MVLECQIPHKIVNLLFTITDQDNTLIFWGVLTSQNRFIDTLCEISVYELHSRLVPSYTEPAVLGCASLSLKIESGCATVEALLGSRGTVENFYGILTPPLSQVGCAVPTRQLCREKKHGPPNRRAQIWITDWVSHGFCLEPEAEFEGAGVWGYSLVWDGTTVPCTTAGATTSTWPSYTKILCHPTQNWYAILQGYLACNPLGP